MNIINRLTEINKIGFGSFNWLDVSVVNVLKNIKFLKF